MSTFDFMHQLTIDQMNQFSSFINLKSFGIAPDVYNDTSQHILNQEIMFWSKSQLTIDFDQNPNLDQMNWVLLIDLNQGFKVQI